MKSFRAPLSFSRTYRFGRTRRDGVVRNAAARKHATAVQLLESTCAVNSFARNRSIATVAASRSAGVGPVVATGAAATVGVVRVRVWRSGALGSSSGGLHFTLRLRKKINLVCVLK